ncbi:serine/threonine-protein kinase bud32 [Steccherinum ochraceum]|uniref:non-specific serine/threonine protein kinase n=1 Tax=Steccherinum ochraceum TaxID=92696 RepID=A0A4V6N7B0_9APHY|nr:serine/threonine-protein kinase bud32 [Steccherinum ochraceum]
MQTSSSSTQLLLASSTLISQGAEAASPLRISKVFKARLHPASRNDAKNSPDEFVLLKYRFNKQYRHPTLDGTLTKARVTGEARAIVKCQRAGVNVPSVRMVDASEGVLGLHWIDGKSVRFLLGGGAEGEEEVDESTVEDVVDEEEEEDLLAGYDISKGTIYTRLVGRDASDEAVEEIMQKIGTEIAKMHRADVIHGDLTTSNMMLYHPRSGRTDLVLIDFGLAYTSTLVEDKAVDLYVLERAFSSTHPASEDLVTLVLKAYEKTMGKEWKSISRRLDDVRLRGRKRSMVG